MAAYLAWRPHTPGTGSPTPRKARPRRPRPAFAAAVLLTGGAALAVLGGLLHPHDEPPNSHAAVFTEYAHSTNWVWIHDLQFLSAAVVVTGFLLLAQALRRADAPAALVRLGETTAAATVALIAANMAVDGVALKRAVDAWVDAPPSEQAGRFAAAEAIRWVEWGLNSFFTMLLGVTVILFAIAVLRTPLTGPIVRAAGAAGILAGSGLLVSGLGVGAHGFEPTVLPLVATALYVLMAIGITPLDRPTRSTASAGPAPTSSKPDDPAEARTQ